MQKYTNRTVVVPRGGTSGSGADSLRVITDTEKGNVTLGKYAWHGSEEEVVTFPLQYLADLIVALQNVQEFCAGQGA